jgi:TRAP-type uncharacterized transport system fused permease subunit
MLGIGFLSAAFSGYLLNHLWAAERIVLGIASILMIAPELTSTMVGLALAVPILLRPLVVNRRARPT